jgi:flagellar basal body P-ring formation protein FlgA
MWQMISLVLLAQPALADSLVATRTIRAQAVIGADDLTLVEAEVPGALTDPSQALGLEARVAIYAGKPVRLSDLSAPALIDRNQVVTLIYLAGGLAISTEGRAMGRAAEGEVIKVINLASRTTVSGRVGPDGAVYVGLEQ